MTRRRRLAPETDVVRFLAALAPARRSQAIERFSGQERLALDRAFAEWAHPGQLPPPGEWSTWVIQAGRGFGKTRAGAEWIAARVAEGGPVSIALVGATLEDARRVMVEGRSGLLEVAGPWLAEWHASLGRLRFRTGAEAQLFSGASPDLLRGPEHHYAWCDELTKWERAEEAWDMLQLGLRLGANPQAVVTTTPRSGRGLEAILADPTTVVTGGPTSANPHTSRAWKQRMTRLYAGTRLGRQELDGEILPEAGALWSVELIEKCRQSSLSRSDGEGDRRPKAGGGGAPAAYATPTAEAPPAAAARGRHHPIASRQGGFTRTLIAVDPPTGDGTCGIVAVAREGSPGPASIAHVLADHSVTARSPEGWARAVAAAAEAHGTTEIVAERNQGGEMVKAILHAADPRLRVRLVHAARGKSQRAEPVAHLCEAGRVRLHGHMPELEAELLRMIAGGGYEGPPGASPDRADAMVWGVSELMKERGEVRVRVV